MLLALLWVAASLPCVSSTLWGERGEAWRAEGRLSDYSYAGYHAGEQEIPFVPIVANLKGDFHAVGDGLSDDSGALVAAIQRSPPGAIFIPAGTYVITRPIKVSRAHVVLRGAGLGKTVLYFPKSFTDMLGNTAKPGEQSQWSFGPGVMDFSSAKQSVVVTKVTSVAKRGDNALSVANASRLSIGQWIRLHESDPPPPSPHAGSLLKWLLGGMLDIGPELAGSKNVVHFPSRIRAVHGNRIVLERALPYDVRLEWKPDIETMPSMEEVGIEELSIRFPHTPYPGHFKEAGFNGISISNAVNCWVRNVQITNADFSLGFDETHFCTASGVVLDVSDHRAESPSSRAPKTLGGAQGWNGHHGIDISQGSDNLVTDFHVRTRFVHDLSVEWFSLNAVYADGDGIDLNLDHHREFNFSSLFTNLDLGEGTRPFESGGAHIRGPHSASYSTFWHLRAQLPLHLPSADFGPNLNFVDVPLVDVPNALPNEWSLESGPVCPVNLQHAMRVKRVGK